MIYREEFVDTKGTVRVLPRPSNGRSTAAMVLQVLPPDGAQLERDDVARLRDLCDEALA